MSTNHSRSRSTTAEVVSHDGFILPHLSHSREAVQTGQSKQWCLNRKWLTGHFLATHHALMRDFCFLADLPGPTRTSPTTTTTDRSFALNREGFLDKSEAQMVVCSTSSSSSSYNSDPLETDAEKKPMVAGERDGQISERWASMLQAVVRLSWTWRSRYCCCLGSEF